MKGPVLVRKIPSSTSRGKILYSTKIAGQGGTAGALRRQQRNTLTGYRQGYSRLAHESVNEVEEVVAKSADENAQRARERSLTR